MKKTNVTIDKTTTPSWRVYREQRFRMPSSPERELGLWVDRIGAATDRVEGRKRRLRILGQYAAVYVVAGRGRFISHTNGERRVESGDAMLLFPEEPAFYWPDSRWETLWVVWNGREAAQLQALGYLDTRHPLVRDELGVVARARQALDALLHREDRDAVLQRKIIVLDMVHRLYRAGQRSEGQEDLRVREAARRMAENATQPISITKLAESAHLSPTHFRRLFARQTGMSPHRFLTAQRMARAKELLARGVPMKAVASETGFRDVFYFMRVFKRETGMTPGTFAALER